MNGGVRLVFGPLSRPGRDVASLAQLLIAGVWVWAGVSKGLDFAGFYAAVEGHGIIPEAARAYLAIVPAYEGLLGLSLALLGGRRHVGGVLLGLSAATFVVFIAYLAVVPPEAFAKVGCGCAASARPTASETPLAPIVRNSLMLALHLPAALGALAGGISRPLRAVDAINVKA